MNYTDKKVDELLDKVTYSNRREYFETIVNEVIRDTRHKVTENLMENYQEKYPFLAGKLNQIVMNTYLD